MTTYFCCCGGTPPPPPPIGACCYSLNTPSGPIMVCEDNIQCSDCARKSQYYFCYPNQTCANIDCPDPPTTTSSTTTTPCPCPFSNCGEGCGPFRFCDEGQFFDCVDCECKDGFTTTTSTTTTSTTSTTTTSSTTSTTTTACPCATENCGCPYGPFVQCGDGQIFDCDVCQCVVGVTSTTSSTTTTTSSTTTTTTTTSSTTSTTEAPESPEVIICCCYDVTGDPTLISCSETDAEGCDNNHDIPGQKCKAYLKGSTKTGGGIGDIYNSCLDCPDSVVFTTTSTTIAPTSVWCIECDDPTPCDPDRYGEDAEYIGRKCVKYPPGHTCADGPTYSMNICRYAWLAPCQGCSGDPPEDPCEDAGCTYTKQEQTVAGLPGVYVYVLTNDTCERPCFPCPSQPCQYIGPGGGPVGPGSPDTITRACGYCW